MGHEKGEVKILVFQIVPWSYGDEGNASWPGAFKALYNQEADIIAGAAIMRYDRSLIADLTYPFQCVHTGMLTVAPVRQRSDAMLIVTEPFQWQVWLMTAACILFSALTLFILSSTLRRVYNEESFSLFESAWVFFSIFVQQGIPEQPRSWSIRILISLWWLASITLMATFTGSLVALFAVERHELPFSSFNELVKLVKQGKYSILMDSKSLTRTEMIANSQLPVYQDLWYEIGVNHRIKYVKGIRSAVNFLLQNPAYVLLGPKTVLKMYEQTDCRLTLLQETILPTYVSIALAKDSPYSTFFSNRGFSSRRCKTSTSRMLLWRFHMYTSHLVDLYFRKLYISTFLELWWLIRELVERGFPKKWIRDYGNYIASRRFDFCNGTSPSKLKSYLDLRRAQGAFWILIGGLLCGILVLFIEIALHYVVKNAGSEDNRFAQFRRWASSYIRENW
ncbi:hypothetical protein Y032_0104g3598 [Ancylostoma ceylanicum]|uniref:Ionotropic glutamate receptor C-terminal domain-containing protein n=1 Tax=Ancylostoma ceylanicum TaxID=53326 RepID=A0A016TGE6_9BILA|nr:hypothetical protein Y032_0104g3598 [Ancylostoma ceylanicum]